MKYRTYALLLALTLSLALLSACGGGTQGEGDASAPQGGAVSSQVGQPPAGGSAPDTSCPEPSAPDLSMPDGSQPGPDASTPDGAAPDASNPDGASSPAQPALNRSDFSLFQAGATFQLVVRNVEGGYQVVYTSSNEQAATVDEDGLVTAVAPGTATITASLTQGNETQKLTCIVRSKFEAETPASGEAGKPGNGSSSSEASGGQVDLAGFYTTISSSYQLGGFQQQADQTLLDQFYPGLSDIAMEQSLVYVCQMSMNNGETALIQVKDSKDVDAVKSILQARIDGMIDGGAWYPGPTELWTNDSRVVSKGSYVMMVVSVDCDAIVSDFNALVS